MAHLARMATLPDGSPAAADEAAADGLCELVAGAQRGDRQAFGELYRRYARTVHGLLLARLPPEDADDLLHEVFLRAMARIGTLRDPAAFPAWLRALARNAAHDLWRTPRRRAAHDELPENLAAAERPDGEAWQVLARIRALPRAYRETLMLRLVEGMSGPEIAARTGLTPDSVRVNLSRGMRKLRALLGEVPS
jgi:RNA polymerase sigma-70 factor, ECF subfamily